MVQLTPIDGDATKMDKSPKKTGKNGRKRRFQRGGPGGPGRPRKPLPPAAIAAGEELVRRADRLKGLIGAWRKILQTADVDTVAHLVRDSQDRFEHVPTFVVDWLAAAAKKPNA